MKIEFGKRGEKDSQLALNEKKQLIEKLAHDQAYLAGIPSYLQEARRIGEACGMFSFGPRGYDNKGMFVTLAMEMLQYEPELGYAIVSQMNRFENEVGYKAAGRLMVTLGQMDSMTNSPIAYRFSYINQRPELGHIVEDRSYRNEKAGKLIAIGILSAALTVKEAAKIYHVSYFDPAVKTSLDKELRAWNPRIAEKIIYPQ